MEQMVTGMKGLGLELMSKNFSDCLKMMKSMRNCKDDGDNASKMVQLEEEYNTFRGRIITGK